MNIEIGETKAEISSAAANHAITELVRLIDQQGEATFVVATGVSQLTFLDELTSTETVDWEKTTMFHLDEYVGLPVEHPASFRHYLAENVLSHIQPGEVHLIDGNAADPHDECNRLNQLVKRTPIDLAFVGIGENGHLAFNDPPADFNTTDPYIVVELDERCKRQQVGEGWFETIKSVPDRAITMSVNQILEVPEIICTIPGARKSRAVLDCFNGPISPDHPASALKQHDHTTIYLDKDSSRLLNQQ